MRRKYIVENQAKNPQKIKRLKRKNKLNIAATVILYNPDERLPENIESYLPHVEKVFVIDNSPNKDNTHLLPDNRKIEYINNKKNLGIAKALNIACEKALDEKYDFILTMDQDSKFEKDNLKKLIDFASSIDTTKVGIISPFHEIITNIREKEIEVDYPLDVMTSGNLLNLKAYKEVGGFKNELFIDNVDVDICMNLRIHGYEIVRYHLSRLYHELGNTKKYNFIIKTVVASNHNAIRRYYITRNLLYIHQMYHEFFPEYCDYLRRIIKYQARNIILFEKDKYRKIRNIYRGYKDFKNNIKGEYPYSN